MNLHKWSPRSDHWIYEEMEIERVSQRRSFDSGIARLTKRHPISRAQRDWQILRTPPIGVELVDYISEFDWILKNTMAYPELTFDHCPGLPVREIWTDFKELSPFSVAEQFLRYHMISHDLKEFWFGPEGLHQFLPEPSLIKREHIRGSGRFWIVNDYCGRAWRPMGGWSDCGEFDSYCFCSLDDVNYKLGNLLDRRCPRYCLMVVQEMTIGIPRLPIQERGEAEVIVMSPSPAQR
jgi:hypothetical protein